MSTLVVQSKNALDLRLMKRVDQTVFPYCRRISVMWKTSEGQQGKVCKRSSHVVVVLIITIYFTFIINHGQAGRHSILQG